MDAQTDCIVVGAGPGGLAAGAMLQTRDLSCVVLERGGRPGHKWRSHYDNLHVNTSTLTSFLPGRRFRLQYGRSPSKEQLVEYCEAYAEDHQLEIRAGCEVRRIERAGQGQGWRVLTENAELRARRRHRHEQGPDAEASGVAGLRDFRWPHPAHQRVSETPSRSKDRR